MNFPKRISASVVLLAFMVLLAGSGCGGEEEGADSQLLTAQDFVGTWKPLDGGA